MIVYTKDNCAACVALKRELDASATPYTEVKIGSDITREDFMVKFPTVRSVPYVVENAEA